MKKIIAINASPRKGWNSDSLVKAAANGAKEAGAEVEYFDLYKLAKFTGCISCFGCKQQKSYGKCICADDLSEVLEKISNADGLIIGSPNYLGNLTSGFRALYERLVFQALTYNKEEPCCNKHLIPVMLIMTSNCDEQYYEQLGYTEMLNGYKKTLDRYVGPTTIFLCGDTLQVNDYSKYNWTIFDADKKKKHHDETFGQYLKQAEKLGGELFK